MHPSAPPALHFALQYELCSLPPLPLSLFLSLILGRKIMEGIWRRRRPTGWSQSVRVAPEVRTLDCRFFCQRLRDSRFLTSYSRGGQVQATSYIQFCTSDSEYVLVVMCSRARETICPELRTRNLRARETERKGSFRGQKPSQIGSKHKR